MASNNVVSGCVKWFNSKQKYGFITVTSEGEHKNVDMFVHQSNVNTKEPCYRFLVAGENVKFEVSITKDEKHPKQAINVSSINDELLKCEVPKQPRVNNYQGNGNSNSNGNGNGNRGGYRGGYQGGYQEGYRGGYQGNNRNTNFNSNRSTNTNTDTITFKKFHTNSEKQSNND